MYPLDTTALVCLLALTLAPGCASNGEKESQPAERFERRVTGQDERSVGKFITDLDGSLSLWANLTMSGNSDRDEARTIALTHDLRYRTNKHKQLLVDELEFGPTPNRIVCAMALGFTEDPAVLSPLLAALEDSNEQVEVNALIGLAVLSSSDTPTGCLTHRILDHPSEDVRAMSAYALLYVVKNGASGEGIGQAALVGLSDSNPIVRSQCLFILGELLESDHVAEMSDLLYDDVTIVRRAAMRNLTWIGEQEETVRGETARALTAALSKTKSARDKQALTQHLMRLSSRNHGDDVDEWLNWANGLP